MCRAIEHQDHLGKTPWVILHNRVESSPSRLEINAFYLSVRLPASVLHLWLVAEGKLKLSFDNGASAENIKSFVIDYKEQMPNDAPELKSFEDDLALRRLTLASEIVQSSITKNAGAPSGGRPLKEHHSHGGAYPLSLTAGAAGIVTAGAVCLA